MDRFTLLLVLWGAFGCRQPPPPPPDCELAPADCESGQVELCKCVPVPPPPEPPPPEPTECAIVTPLERRTPKCYVTMVRLFEDTEHMRSLQDRMLHEAEEVLWAARNFDYAARSGCETEDSPYEVTHAELALRAEAAFLAYYGRSSEADVRDRGLVHPSYATWLERMVVHRRCVIGEESPWCGRSTLYKPVFDPWRQLWLDVLMTNREIDSRGPAGVDGIRRYCRDQTSQP